MSELLLGAAIVLSCLLNLLIGFIIGEKYGVKSGSIFTVELFKKHGFLKVDENGNIEKIV